MGKTAILAIRIIGDATSAVASLDDVEGSAGGMQRSLDKASGAAAVALGGLTAAAVAAGNAASEAEQATGAVDSVFGSLAGKIHEYAAAADQAVGLSNSAYSNMAAVLGSQLKNMGLDLDASASQTQALIEKGADLSSMFGGTTADAVGALSSLLRGERDPIERYGVSIKEADIAAQAAKMGLEELYRAGDRNASLQATLALLNEQTADATGQFAREADTAAGQQQRANAAWENAAATLGEQLLPFMTEGSMILSDLATWIAENSELVTFLAVAVGGLAGGILLVNGALKAFQAVQALATAAQWASNAAILASPVTWIIVAIGLLIAIIVLLIANWDKVSAVASDVWGGVVRWFEDVVQAVKDAVAWLGQLASKVVPSWVTDLFGAGSASFSASLAIDEPPAMQSRMAFTADDTMRAFAQPAAASRANVSTMAAVTPDRGLFGTDSPRGGDTYNITNQFSGLVTDEQAVANAIRGVLESSDKASGRALAGRPGA